MPTTYHTLYAALRRRLQAAGIEACALEARLLTACAAGLSQEALLRDLQRPAAPEVVLRLEALAARRLAGEPVAYITGRWAFYGLELTVTPAVLIPRSDTETLVDQALALVEAPAGAPRILDLCTGSGCIACALGVRLPGSRLVLGDLSPAALELAARNAADCGLDARAVCRTLDALAPPPPDLGSFDLIVSNPPYIPAAELDTLDRSVREFEPHMALDGGPDGLDFYRAIVAHWTPLLRPGGWLLLEIGDDQAGAVTRLLRLAGMQNISVVQDAAGRDRVVRGRADTTSHMNFKEN